MVAVLVVDARHRCRFLNAVAEALCGQASAQTKGHALADVLWRGTPGPFDGSRLASALAHVAGGEGEETIVGADGTARPYAFRVVPLGSGSDRDGAVVELVDLSGETGTGRALRESEQRLRLAVEATGIGIWDVNAVTGKRRWSPEMYDILGLPRDTPADPDLFARLILPDDREPVLARHRRAYASPEAGVFEAEFRIARPSDHAVRWVAVSGRVTFDAAGKAIRGVGTIRDIDERRRIEEALRDSEERQRLAVEANDVGTWDWDMVAGTHRWSPIFKHLWGLPAGAPSDPALLAPLVGPTEQARMAALWRELSAEPGLGRVSLEYQFRRADDGEQRWCSVTGRIFFDEMSGRPVRALGIMTDVTERRAVEERQRLILREMNHRIKNTLALVQAIVSQTIRLTPDPDQAFDRIQSRLMSLARTHDFLNRGNWGGVPLHTLIEGEVAPFAPDPGRVSLHGEPVALDSSAMFALGLTLHELASNAVRHGALSVPDGHVDIDWTVDGTDGTRRLTIDWRERDGPPASGPARVGFGSRLIDANVTATLGGEALIQYLPDGVHAHLSFPLKPAAVEDAFPEQRR